MIRDPKSWRLEEGLTLEEVATKAGIEGQNPAATYRRYEIGEHPCPPQVIETVRVLSDGQIGAESWHAVRMAHVSGEQPSLAFDGRR